MPTTPYCQPGSSCCCSAARGLALLALFLLACSGEAPARDWRADPALLELDAVPLTYAISDIHGGYDRLVALLLRHQLLRAAPPSPDQAEWSAGRAVLVVTGDLFDSGPAGVEVLDLLRALQARASEAGGRVVVTLGNHEAEFLVSASNKKATAQNGISTQLTTRGLQPSEVAQGLEARGRWLRALPFATRIGRWFFSHAGDTHGRSTAALSAALQQGVDFGKVAARLIGLWRGVGCDVPLVRRRDALGLSKHHSIGGRVHGGARRVRAATTKRRAQNGKCAETNTFDQ